MESDAGDAKVMKERNAKENCTRLTPKILMEFMSGV